MYLLAHCGQIHFSFGMFLVLVGIVIYFVIGRLIFGKRKNQHRVEYDMNQVSGHICNCSLEEEDWGQNKLVQPEEEDWGQNDVVQPKEENWNV
ncbi:hypothetical protein HN858_01185 [Candidatus Falkowbacteria bacterium]|jgi:hypothetical protein|nr:hypothetical protein [Candidatus Falkowbacteria bacterium]MBT6573658.1 hypothetical protein [Candidatus Falkowbacteria bacterium]MBT7348269.1 hypothetical protein [Candidatus Falkowbacteria bacterium]MBT7500129.1 hypothetical protein [Candidatus Falkowbacteria bacterium]